MFFSFNNILIGIVTLFVCLFVMILWYFNKKRTILLEKFLDISHYEITPTTCSNGDVDNIQCNEISSIDDLRNTAYSTLTLLIDINRDLNSRFNELTITNTSLSNELSDSNSYRNALSTTNDELNTKKSELTETESNYKEISALLTSMDGLQGKTDALAELEYTIVGGSCDGDNGEDNMSCSNQGLIDKETFTKQKLESILQKHIDIVPELSESYLLAVKLWIAYKKSELLLLNTNTNMTNALNAYNDTLMTLKNVETSMFRVIEIYRMYKDNFFYTSSNTESDNDVITLSNLVGSDTLTIPFNSDDSDYRLNLPENDSIVNDELFKTCRNTATDTVVVQCSHSNYSRIIETIPNCTDATCLKKQSINVKSGLEYIYRSKFSRNFVNDYISTGPNQTKADVDRNIQNEFIGRVFI